MYEFDTGVHFGCITWAQFLTAHVCRWGLAGVSYSIKAKVGGSVAKTTQKINNCQTHLYIYVTERISICSVNNSKHCSFILPLGEFVTACTMFTFCSANEKLNFYAPKTLISPETGC